MATKSARIRTTSSATPGSSKAPTSGYFSASDGAPLWFEDSGGDGPVLFYVYGLACSIQHWKYPRQHFGESGARQTPRRSVYLDFRGHGRSPAPRGKKRVTMSQLVDDIEALCAARGITEATFLGQSLGGTIALSLAKARPDLVRGLVLLASPGRNPGPYFAMQPFSQLLWRSLIRANRQSPLTFRMLHAATIEALRSPVLRIPFREMVRHYGFNPRLARTSDIDDYIAHVFDVSANVFFDLAADLALFDISQIEGSIQCPALVIAGARDQLIPLSEQEWLAAQMPQSRMAVLDHGSHCPHFDDPTQVIKVLESFFEEHDL